MSDNPLLEKFKAEVGSGPIDRVQVNGFIRAALGWRTGTEVA